MDRQPSQSAMPMADAEAPRQTRSQIQDLKKHKQDLVNKKLHIDGQPSQSAAPVANMDSPRQTRGQIQSVEACQFTVDFVNEPCTVCEINSEQVHEVVAAFKAATGDDVFLSRGLPKGHLNGVNNLEEGRSWLKSFDRH